MKFQRVGICALLVFGVAAHGGVEDWARAVLESGVGVLLVAWAARAYFYRAEQIVVPPRLLPLGALVLLVLAQWGLHHTALAYGTRTELQLLLADSALLFLAAQAFRSMEDWKGFIWFAMIFAFLVCTFGILQHLTFNGKLYWFREMRFGGIPFGPYVNRNHFAAFAELLIPISLVPLLLGKVRHDRWFIVGLFTVLQLGALLLTASRGGIAGLGVELVVLAGWLAMRRPDGKLLLAGAAILAMVALLVSWVGIRQITERFAAMQQLEASQSKRIAMARDTWHIFLEHPVWGTGLGTLEAVFPPYDTLYDGKIVNHSHNDYLEALAETGTPAGLCCLWFLGVLFSQGIARARPGLRTLASMLQFSALLGCVGFLVHSLFDFNLHIPANAMLFFLLTCLATTDIAPGATDGVNNRSRRRNR